jgi:prespore-specific regulator
LANKLRKLRSDAWTEEQDHLLADTVLKFVREGKTQLAAFKEVGNKLGRTASACAFRFNNELRSRYTKALALAKKQGQAKKKLGVTKKGITSKAQLSDQKQVKENIFSSQEESLLTKENVIAFIQKHLLPESVDMEEIRALREENANLQASNAQLQEQIQKYEQEILSLRTQLKEYEEDLHEAIAIIKKAASISGRLNKVREHLVDHYEEEMKIAQ